MKIPSSFVGLLASLAPSVAAAAPQIVVTDSAELEAALVEANAGRHIVVRAGTYIVSRPLFVPDGVTLEGEGVMTYDADGLPLGFVPETRTLLVDALGAGVSGDILTLGDGVGLARIAIHSAAEPPGAAVPSLVAVTSRGPDDVVSVTIEECELVTPNGGGIEPRGPTGRALNVLTLDPPDAEAHQGAWLSVKMDRSMIRSLRGLYGIGAINLAPDASIDLKLQRNYVGGGLNGNGGVSRPNAVTGSTVTIHSRDNWYGSRPGDPVATFGLRLHGGSTPPIGFLPLVIPETTDDVLRMTSVHDRIEGVYFGVYASAGWRALPVSAALECDDNLSEVELHGTRIRTLFSDLVLVAAEASAAGVSPGDRNRLRMLLRGVTGSCHGATGPCTRANVYLDAGVAAPLPVLYNPLPTDTNALELVGNPMSFAATNDGISPPPPDAFFTAP